MDRRIPYHLKGKGKTNDYSPPPRKRIRAPELDTSDLIRENSLTLMGRLTNPKVQRLWSLIPFLSNRWNLRGKAVGADLGDEVGEVLDHEITPAVVKMKILLDGLQPLVKETIVEFPDGREALVTLEYKNLKSHCHHCLRLSHEKKDCPGLAASNHSDHKKPSSSPRDSHSSKVLHSPTKRDNRPRQNNSFNKSLSYNHSQADHIISKKRYGEENHRAPSYSEGRSHSQRNYNNTRRSPPRLKEPSRSYVSHRREPSRESSGHYHSSQRQNLQWREKPVSRGNNRNDYLDSSDSSRARRPPLERTVTVEVTPPPLLPIPTTTEVMGELRDVTVQYTSCADPTESAARKQRVLQGEARGLMAQTAEMIVAAATLTNHSFLETVTSPSDNLPDKSQDLPVHPADIPVSTLPNATKRRGRPPLNKPKPTQLTGSKSSKRNKVLIQNSPKRRNTPERVGQPEVTINSTCKGSNGTSTLIRDDPWISLTSPRSLWVLPRRITSSHSRLSHLPCIP
ncbi:unnamed protein product [Arabidopsis halleri]